MKRTLTLFLAAIASAAMAQTPTVVEKPADKTNSTKTAAKTAAKTPAQSSKPSPATVKVVPVPAQKSVAVKPAALPAQSATTVTTVTTVKTVAVPAHSATVKPAAVAAVHSSAVAPVKTVTVATPAKTVVVAAPVAHPGMASAKPVTGGSAPKLAAVPVKAVPVNAVSAKADPFKSSAAAQKAPAKMSSVPVSTAVAAKSNPAAQSTVAVQDNKAANDNKTTSAKPLNTAGRRDPFVSPVINQAVSGSGCSSGKRCLAIDQVALKGIVKSDTGMIAVVVNAMDKAYFLHENDPVFNGYVLKINVDSIVFKETFHDKLGKPLTRDVTKTISRPVA